MRKANAPDEATREKAVCQILNMIENAWKPRDQRELAEWIVSELPAATVAGCAADWDEWNAACPENGQEGGGHA